MHPHFQVVNRATMHHSDLIDEAELARRFTDLLKQKPHQVSQILELVHLANETPASLGLSSILQHSDPFAISNNHIDSILAPFAPPPLCPSKSPAKDDESEEKRSLSQEPDQKCSLSPQLICSILRTTPAPPEESPRTFKRPKTQQANVVQQEASIRPVDALVQPTIAPGSIARSPAPGPSQIYPSHGHEAPMISEELVDHPALAPEFSSQSPGSSRKRPYKDARQYLRPMRDPPHYQRKSVEPRHHVRADPRRPMQPHENTAERGALVSGPFRTAQSKLLQDKRNRNKRSGMSGDGEHRGAPREQDGGMPSANLRQVGRAVFGAKRGRLGAPRSGLSAPRGAQGARTSAQPSREEPVRDDLPEIPNVEPKLVEMIMNEMLDQSPGVDWDDIAGLHFAKRCVMEAIVWPMKRPDIFTGLRGPPKGLLLFGPPGTGKTLIGRAIASKSGAKFFNISASSLMSKWVGEGEKLVRALFAVAREFQPSVVFIDEIDSLLTQRSEADQEGSRRIKTEFLVQMDGAGTSREDRVLVVGATNRPQELDEAARRRLVKRLYIPLPDDDARRSMVKRLLKKSRSNCSESDFDQIVRISAGYSGSDMYALCAEAALGPVRDLGESIGNIDESSVRAISKGDFEVAAKMVRASVSSRDLDGYVEWNKTFGSFPMDDPKQKSIPK